MSTHVQPSAAGVPTFRELSGDEAATAFAHDLEQAILSLLATGQFRERAKELFLKTGRFGLGACYPVVIMNGQLQIKVYTSVESYRSNEKLPAPFNVDVALETGEMQPDSEKVVEGNGTIRRAIGTEVGTAVDKIRKEVGLDVLVPTRNEHGYVENSKAQAETRTADYAARLAKRKDTMAKRQAERDAELANEQERERIAKEQEARGTLSGAEQ